MDKKNDFSTKCDELLKKIEEDCDAAKEKKALVRSMEALQNKRSSENVSFFTAQGTNLENDDEMDLSTDDSSKFEDFLALYLSDYKNMSGDIKFEELLAFLPARNNGYYSDLIKRLIFESMHEISVWSNYHDSNSDDLSTEDLQFYSEFIKSERKKIALLRKALVHEDTVSNDDEVEENKLVLVPTPGGNIRIIEDLQHISPEYYPAFLELIKSIQEGTFTYLKPIAYGLKSTIFEVKGFKERVVFARIKGNHYALISAFVKKADTDKQYRNNLFRQYDNFKKQEGFLIESLDWEEFVKENDLQVEEMYRLLGKESSKKLKRGELHG